MSPSDPAAAPMAPEATPAPSLAIVIVNYRTAAFTIQCVDSLIAERATAGPFEVIVADGHSPDDSVETLTRHFADPAYAGWVSVLPLAMNGGFGWANNQAMLRLLQRAAPPEFIHILNPDCLVAPGAIRALLDVIVADPALGAVGSQLFEPDGHPTGSAFRFPSPGREFVAGSGIPTLGKLLGIPHIMIERDDPGPVDWVAGASILFRSAALRRTGLFDDGFFLYSEEVELMHRLVRAGWSIWTVPASHIMHIGGASTGVAGGTQVAVRPSPPYVYQSRRRYFMRTGGAIALVAANLAWLAGYLAGAPLRLLTRRHGRIVPRAFAMTLRYCLWPQAGDRRASIPPWDEPPGRPPAWMQH